jgi:hypothetical protein
MTLRTASVHENDAHLVRLCQLSRLGRFCQLKDTIDFNNQTLMALKPPLFPGSGFRVLSFEFQVSICGSDSIFVLELPNRHCRRRALCFRLTDSLRITHILF